MSSKEKEPPQVSKPEEKTTKNTDCKHLVCAVLTDTIMWRNDFKFGDLLMTFCCLTCNHEITTTPNHLERLGMKYF